MLEIAEARTASAWIGVAFSNIAVDKVSWQPCDQANIFPTWFSLCHDCHVEVPLPAWHGCVSQRGGRHWKMGGKAADFEARSFP